MYRKLLNEKSFLRILFAGIINRFGDSIDAIAMTWLMFSISHSPSLTALNFGVNFIPTVCIQPLAGAYVERQNHKRVLVCMDFLRGFLVLTVAVLTYSHHILPYMLLISTFLLSTAEAFRIPANTALVPSIVSKEKYAEAQALQTSLFRLSELIGTGLAGIIISIVGIHGAILIDALTFFFSGFIILSIKIKNISSTAASSHLLNSFISGITYLKYSRKVLFFCFLGLLLNTLLLPINSLETVLYADVYHKGAELLSVTGIFIIIGNILGAFVYPFLNKYICEKLLVTIFFLSIGFFYFSCIFNEYLLSQPPLFYLSLIFFHLLLGGIAAYLGTYSSTNLLEKVEKGYLARVTAVSTAISTGAIPVGSVIISGLSAFLDIRTIFTFVGILSIGLSLLYGIIKRKEENSI